MGVCVKKPLITVCALRRIPDPHRTRSRVRHTSEEPAPPAPSCTASSTVNPSPAQAVSTFSASPVSSSPALHPTTSLNENSNNTPIQITFKPPAHSPLDQSAPRRLTSAPSSAAPARAPPPSSVAWITCPRHVCWDWIWVAVPGIRVARMSMSGKTCLDDDQPACRSTCTGPWRRL